MAELNSLRMVTRLGLWLSDPIPSHAAGGLLESASALAQAAEKAGFDSLWLNDRALGIDERLGPDAAPGADAARDACRYEAYSLLGALATRTRAIRLGILPVGIDSRAPSIVTKMVTAIDLISHGRSVVTLGLNSREGEVGTSRLAESLQVCRAMMEDDWPEFAGHVYQISGAMNLPRPVQEGGVPLVVLLDGGDQIKGRARIDGLRIAAQYADAVVVGGDVATVEEAVGAAASSGDHRPPQPASESARSTDSDMSRVIWVGTLLIDSDTDATSVHPGSTGVEGPARPVIAGSPVLSGSPAQVAEQLRERTLAGADGCIVSFAGDDQLEAIATYGPVLLDAVDPCRGSPTPNR